MNRGWNRYLGWVLLICWLAVTFAALAGMYTLWWQRELVLYPGKNVGQQREMVFQRAGFPASLVAKIDRLDRQWSKFIHYSIKGDLTTTSSYIKYLLLPRIPSGESSHVVTVNGDELIAVGTEDDPLHAAGHLINTKKFTGFFLSLFFMTGLGLFIRKITSTSISWPEFSGLSCLFLTMLVLIIRFFTFSATMAFLSAMLIGLMGWTGLFISFFQKKYSVGSKKMDKFYSSISTIKNVQKKERVISAVLLAVIVFTVVWSFIMAVIVVPDWAIWGSKAKVLALGAGLLHDVAWFDHSDYPLLWPTVWAFFGWLSGGWEEYWNRG